MRRPAEEADRALLAEELAEEAFLIAEEPTPIPEDDALLEFSFLLESDRD